MRALVLLLTALPALAAAPAFVWENGPELPTPPAVSGAFAGLEGGSLLVCGGAFFEVSPFQGGAKQWTDRCVALDGPAGAWRDAGRLPRPLGYGAAATGAGGSIWAGGSDAEGHFGDAWRVTLDGGEARFDPLPPLPRPLANSTGAVLDGVFYVVGGQEAPESVAASRAVYRLDPLRPGDGWREVEPLPGPGRIFPAVAAQDGALYVFSGAELAADADGRPARRFLADGWRYRPGQGWRAVTGPPAPAAAAPALAWGPAHIFVFGGDDGSNFFRNEELGDSHPGFPRSVLAYHTIGDAWTALGETPAGLVTTSAVAWNGRVAIPGGEDRPGHRSPTLLLGAPAPAEAAFRPLDYLAVALYLAGLVAIGLHFARRESTTDDFFLAGRRIPWWAAGLSIYGTQLSSISFIAVPAKVYSTDWVYLLVQLSIILIAIPVVFLYLPFYRNVAIVTAYEYLERRFNLAVRLFASASFILFQVGRMAIVLYLPAIALSTVTGLSVFACILVMGVLATLYTAAGGIEAVIWTDVLQVFVLLGGAFLSLGLILGDLDGGLGALLAQGAAAGKLHVFNWTWDHTTTAVWVVLGGNLFNNLVPYTADQAVVQRYLTTKDERAAARGIWLNAAMLIPSTLVLFLLGTGLWAFYRARPELLNPHLPADSIFPLFISQQLPAGLAGLVIAGVFAASMSTLDSSLNSVATAISTDFRDRLWPGASDANRLRLARRLTLGLGALATGAALGLATFQIGSLWDAFQGMMGLLGAGLAGLFALGIFTTRAHGAGALAGAFASALVLAWVQRATNIHFFLYGMVGVCVCFAVGYAASVLLPGGGQPLAGLTLWTRDPAKPSGGSSV